MIKLLLKTVENVLDSRKHFTKKKFPVFHSEKESSEAYLPFS